MTEGGPGAPGGQGRGPLPHGASGLLVNVFFASSAAIAPAGPRHDGESGLCPAVGLGLAEPTITGRVRCQAGSRAGPQAPARHLEFPASQRWVVWGSAFPDGLDVRLELEACISWWLGSLLQIAGLFLACPGALLEEAQKLARRGCGGKWREEPQCRRIDSVPITSWLVAPAVRAGLSRARGAENPCGPAPSISGAGLGPAAGGGWGPSPCGPSARLQAGGKLPDLLPEHLLWTCRQSVLTLHARGGAFWFT